MKKSYVNFSKHRLVKVQRFLWIFRFFIINFVLRLFEQETFDRLARVSNQNDVRVEDERESHRKIYRNFKNKRKKL